jgi:osmotically-inducible protein OsmY
MKSCCKCASRTGGNRAGVEVDHASQRIVWLQTNNGTVILDGQVASSEAAARAVRDALKVAGVGRVEDRLTWPTAAFNSKEIRK